MKKILGFNPKFWCGDRMNIIRLSSYTSPDLKLHLPRSQATPPHISSYTSQELKLHLPRTQATPPQVSPRAYRCESCLLLRSGRPHQSPFRTSRNRKVDFTEAPLYLPPSCDKLLKMSFKAHCTSLRNPFPYLLTNSLSNLLPDRLITDDPIMLP